MMSMRMGDARRQAGSGIGGLLAAGLAFGLALVGFEARAERAVAAVAETADASSRATSKATPGGRDAPSHRGRETGSASPEVGRAVPAKAVSEKPRAALSGANKATRARAASRNTGRSARRATPPTAVTQRAGQAGAAFCPTDGGGLAATPYGLLSPVFTASPVDWLSAAIAARASDAPAAHGAPISTNEQLPAAAAAPAVIDRRPSSVVPNSTTDAATPGNTGTAGGAVPPAVVAAPAPFVVRALPVRTTAAVARSPDVAVAAISTPPEALRDREADARDTSRRPAKVGAGQGGSHDIAMAGGAASASKSAAIATESSREGGGTADQYLRGRDHEGRGEYALALRWYLLAAEAGYGPAQKAAANLYGGMGEVPRDYARAIYWHRRAAENGERIDWPGTYSSASAFH